ncbi:hypothetical protein DL766_007602 [Monosporascus sp. MC13-8B]|uniref:Fungal lipase-like domain-containing protein n=1 Tax=Monosporascus cannonballus TaxID=155416 RepID=A0ABY0GZG5_9PEZI|nr:hypothetical protein DL762_008782 [Monosporascus cannonballus]RYO82496.1 hypothetical protein DL763_008209 [Monosporascus cannonballus]RYP22882.1 hypothetical protein DL766_007602 [Monosporascus sp. MC13-8B]
MKPFSWVFISSLAAVAVAGPIPEALPYNVNNRAITVTDSEVKVFDFYAQYAAASYCNSEVPIRSTVACSNNACPEVTKAGAKVLATFGGIITDIQGFISVDDKNKLIVASFKGSTSIRNWIADLVFLQVPCDLVKNCALHAGFATAWGEIDDKVLAGIKAAKAANPSYKIIFTGHSLGGAVATIGAGYIRNKGYNIDIYSYGSPRAGNKAFVKHVTEQAGLEYRITHLSDPVPRLPPILLNYRHTSPEYWFHTSKSNTTEYTAADAKVCEGHASVRCNAGTFGLDIDAHLHYFQDISACSKGGIEWRRDVTPEMGTTEPEQLTDEELEAKLDELVAEDIEYSATLEED